MNDSGCAIAQVVSRRLLIVEATRVRAQVTQCEICVTQGTGTVFLRVLPFSPPSKRPRSTETVSPRDISNNYIILQSTV
jgi:hypothetical protein